MRISKADRKAISHLCSNRELLKNGNYYGTATRSLVDVKRMDSLARRGLAKITMVGESRFAEPTEKSFSVDVS